MVKLLCFISAVVLFCSGFSSAEDSLNQLVEPKFFWNINRTVLLDRAVNYYESPGYYLLPVDRTAFSVDHYVYFDQFNLSKVFLYHKSKEEAIEDVAVNYQIVEIKDQVENILHVGRIKLSSKHVSSAVFPTIVLKPYVMYEIRLELPKDFVLMYLDNLEIKQYTLFKLFRLLHVKFYQHNADEKPDGIEGTSRKVSHGLVRHLHLKYHWF